MIVRSLRLRDFRRFESLELALDGGLSVICGANEAGKSTIQKALLVAFYEKPSATARDVQALKRWGASERFRVEIELEADGSTWRLEKDFQAKRARLERIGPGPAEVIDDIDEVQGRLISWLGCPTERFFLSTACVQHDEIARIDGDKARLTEQLQKVVAGGADAGAPQVLKKLEDAIRDLNKGAGGTAKNVGPGNLAYWEREIERLGREREQVAAASGSQTRRADELAGLEARFGELSSAARATEAIVADAERVARLDEEITALDEPYHKLARAEERAESLAEAEAAASTSAGERGGAEEMQRLIELEAAASAKERNALQAAMAAGAAKMGAPRDEQGPGGGLLAGAGLVLAGAGIALWLIAHGSAWLILAAAGLLAFVTGLVLRASAARKTRLKGERLAQALTTQTAADAQAARAQVDRALAAAGVSSVAEAQAMGSASGEAEAARREAQARLDEALAGESLEGLRNRARSNAVLLGQKRDERAVIAEALPPEDNVRQARARLPRLRSELTETRTAIDRLTGEMGLGAVDADGLTSIEESLAEACRRRDVLARRLRVYERARAGIAAAQEETMQRVTPQLERAIGDHVEMITGGRYSQARVSEKDMRITAIAPETGEEAQVDGDLSAGTRDQFYLAARVGLVELLCGKAGPPLILDEPFSGFDDTRTARAWELLERIAEDHQVIVLTCRAGAPAGTLVPLSG